MNDKHLMRRCLELARTAGENGDAPVGSLVWLNDKIIAEGIESVKSTKDPTAHAEIIAVRAACQSEQSLDLSGATLYTNVEPCWMCAFAIRQTGISRVVFAVSNEQVGAVTSKFNVLTDSGFALKFMPPNITSNLLKNECESLMNEFLKSSQPSS